MSHIHSSHIYQSVDGLARFPYFSHAGHPINYSSMATRTKTAISKTNIEIALYD